MKVTFYGAAHEVTGSCHRLSFSDKHFLFDCGMFQGSDFNEGRNNEPFPFAPSSIKAVLVSHAHLDHVGRLPKLVREGFSGPIYSTDATKELALLVLRDAYQIMISDHEKFQTPILFSEADITETRARFVGVEYGVPVQLATDVTAVWKDVGHIFGSAFIELTAEGKTIAFSGDIGNHNVPILKDTEPLGAVDVLLCESTYGDRLHEDIDTRRQLLLSLIRDGVKKGGTIMIPAFSIERTQEILYELHTLSLHDKTLPRVPIYLDSPLSIDATAVFKRFPRYYDHEAAQAQMLNDDFLNFPLLHLSYTREQSKFINNVLSPKIIIAGAGMMNGGRILHHARRYLSDPRSTLIIVGYQASGTLGRRLYDGMSSVKIFGDLISVRCTIKAIGALSAHADQKKIIDWIKKAKNIPKKVFCVHGEPAAATALADRLRQALSIETYVPDYGESAVI